MALETEKTVGQVYILLALNFSIGKRECPSVADRNIPIESLR